MTRCIICGWGLRCHRHHIIPLSGLGLDCEENKVFLCPNHHVEAHLDIEEFNKKYNLIGKKNSKERIDALGKVGILIANDVLSKEEKDDCLYLMIKYSIMNEEAIAYIIGLSVNYYMRKYLGMSDDLIRKKRDEFNKLCILKRKELKIK